MTVSSSTSASWPGWTFRDDTERQETRIRLARLLVRQAKLLKHDVDPSVLADAARPLPDDRQAS